MFYRSQPGSAGTFCYQHPCCPRQSPESCKMVVCVCVCCRRLILFNLLTFQLPTYIRSQLHNI